VKRPLSVEQSSLFLRPKAGAGDRVYWDAQWRYRVDGGPWRQTTRRLGPAWQERESDGKWRKRPGRCREGWLDERAANVAAVAAMEQHGLEVAEARRADAALAADKPTVRKLGQEWLEWLDQVRGAKPSTIQDYGYLLRDPGADYKRSNRVAAGRIMAAFGDRPYDEVTATEVSKFLRSLDREQLTPRNVNKHRQLLAAIFNYACRVDTYGLSVSPVQGTDKRREDPPAALDYYEVHEVEALAACCEQGLHRPGPQAKSSEEIYARAQEDRRDAELFRVLFYTGLRLGELLVLRVEDVDLTDRLLLVRRGLSAGEESTPKGRRHRFVPLSVPARDALRRALDRADFIAPDDYVFANRLGRRLDGSALRRRYKRACAKARLRPVKLHGLRHSAGSLIARTNDPVFVRDFLGHSELSTTDRYVSAKLRPEEFERLDRAFGVTSEAQPDRQLVDGGMEA
jgi:integrase